MLMCVKLCISIGKYSSSYFQYISSIQSSIQCNIQYFLLPYLSLVNCIQLSVSQLLGTFLCSFSSISSPIFLYFFFIYWKFSQNKNNNCVDNNDNLMLINDDNDVSDNEWQWSFSLTSPRSVQHNYKQSESFFFKKHSKYLPLITIYLLSLSSLFVLALFIISIFYCSILFVFFWFAKLSSSSLYRLLFSPPSTPTKQCFPSTLIPLNSQ